MPGKQFKDYTPDAFLKKAADVAHFYGFRPMHDLLGRAASRRRAKSEKTPSLKERVSGCEELFVDLVQNYATKRLNLLSQPLLAYGLDSDLPKSRLRAAKQQQTGFGLFVIGCDRSIAEALILKTTLAILAECGVRESCVAINGIGSRDSTGRFARELTSYFRKNLHAIPAPCRQALKRDAFDALECVRKRAPAIAEQTPTAMQFLSEESRAYLREVLEYLEIDETPYEIDERLTGPLDCYSNILFEVRDKTAEEMDGAFDYTTYAYGGRFDNLGRRMYRVNLSAAGSVISLPRPPRAKTALPEKRERTPDVYFIHLGFQAKLRALPIMEILRREKIVVHHSFSEERLGAQFEDAERCGVAYTIIIGQKEAVEGVAIVRDMNTRAQDTIPIDKLAAHIKKLCSESSS